MILSKLKLYLKTIVGEPSIHFVWNDEHNEKLFSYLNEHLDDETIDTLTVQATIKKALREHFESLGNVLFKISSSQLRMKLFPYKIEPKDSINLEYIFNIIDENSECIEYEYNDKKDLICLNEDITIKLKSFVNHITNEEINKKELLKYAIREALELKSSDIIIIKNSQIFIKIFDTSSCREIADSEKNTIAQRYNGIEDEHLISFYKNFFAKDEYKNFFYEVAEQFVEIYMLEKKIDNVTYEKYVFSYIQSIIIEHLERLFEHNQEFFKGFSGYIFRIHFKEVFGYIANMILSEISASNKYMINFLKYYSLNVIVIDSQKYKVPEIEAENGLKWSVSSMMSIVKIYIKTDQSIDSILNKKEELQDSINDLYVNGLSPMEYKSIITKESDKISLEIAYLAKKLNLYTDSLYLSKNEQEKERLKSDIKDIRLEMQLKREEHNKLLSKMINKADLHRYNNVKREIDALTRQEKREEKILEQNEDAFFSITNSLVKALTSKKILLEGLN
ncbi:hypothetical protein Suden_1450 [Sulfurimonas denitrificans DSM 1251]|uniref:Uncharacterized protein n=1 Tax=Sulfurimonas denitrificans (strain ATCC 33889 / DSM 1251) TaxID=326298 RepID=Q30QK4_SULDN|nr:hypothetical protein [Sulfurimonas denitrificans]ABB44727.1 hypothetical protein Suden_1450 [Sulfurimonas denitrificans DSM 1251]MDD3443037.1 hypothetical protein [Sulfurimonas denitrificans]